MRFTPAHRDFLRAALHEDIGTGDITTDSIISPESKSSASFIAKSGFVLAGLPIAREVFRLVEPRIKFRSLRADGEHLRRGDVFATVQGSTRAILMAERVALNILQRLCGIATLSDQFVRQVKGTGATILDTRKTTPLMREMEKYAVRMGGATNHRMGLYDMVLIKDNHIKAAGGITEAVRLARAKARRMKIEVECESLCDVEEAILAGADIVMLDNMTTNMMRRAVRLTAGRVKLEASGNVSLKNIRAIAKTGVDYISIGALTHSAPSADISLRF